MCVDEEEMRNCRREDSCCKRIRRDSMRNCRERHFAEDPFQRLPDDLVIAVFVALGSTASCPADLQNAMLVCKRFSFAVSHPWVLARAGNGALSVKASKWSDGAYRFLKRCSDLGNVEAAYILGMISFYCLKDRTGGASLMARAAMASHAEALHSLSVIKFNGSGGIKAEKDPRAGVALCARAAWLGNIDAMRDLGHCFQDGYGVPANLTQGRRLLLEANTREAMACGLITLQKNSFCYIPSNRNLPAMERHPVHRFLVDWFAQNPPEEDLRMCSYEFCGRPETRRHEFRRCSACGTVNYCSRGCQALHWRNIHRFLCSPSLLRIWPPLEPHYVPRFRLQDENPDNNLQELLVTVQDRDPS